MKGIDISRYQNKPDFKRVKSAGIQFVMLKATEGVNYTDPCFKTNAAAAISAGLPIGVYHFLRAGDVSAQVRDCLVAIKPLKITWPVAVDVEHNELLSMGRDKLTDMVLDFCAKIKAAGYQPMVYSNYNWLYCAKYLDVARIKAAGIPIWMAWYSKATPNNTNRSNLCDMWQYASDGKADGITSNGLDMNISYKDFATPKTIVDIDTTMDIAFARGTYYVVKTTCPQPVQLTYGTGDVATIVPFPRNGNDQLFAIVPIGQSGQKTGIYTAVPGEKPLRRFVFKIK